MVETGAIYELDKTEALEEIHGLKFERHYQDIKAAHFVLEYVIQQLEAKYGKERLFTITEGSLNKTANTMRFKAGT